MVWAENTTDVKKAEVFKLLAKEVSYKTLPDKTGKNVTLLIEVEGQIIDSSSTYHHLKTIILIKPNPGRKWHAP